MPDLPSRKLCCLTAGIEIMEDTIYCSSKSTHIMGIEDSILMFRLYKYAVRMKAKKDEKDLETGRLFTRRAWLGYTQRYNDSPYWRRMEAGLAGTPPPPPPRP